MKRNLSYYFRIPKENKMLSKPVIDYIVENLPTTQKNDLMNAYIYLIENDEKFSKIESEYSFDLAVIYFMYCGKYLDNNFTIEEISQILDISYEDTYQNIHVLKKI